MLKGFLILLCLLNIMITSFYPGIFLNNKQTITTRIRGTSGNKSSHKRKVLKVHKIFCQ